MVVYCPYTDKEIDPARTNEEHIIPLSLGGSNQYTIPVDAEFNSKVGTKIDGQLGKDISFSLQRQKTNARGHSKKPPQTVIKNAELPFKKKPMQMVFVNDHSTGQTRIDLFDPVNKKTINLDELDPGERIDAKIKVANPHLVRFRFVAKVALAAGYKLFGDKFKNHVDHAALRAVMNLSSSADWEMIKKRNVQGYSDLTPIPEKLNGMIGTYYYMCTMHQGSTVIAAFWEGAIVFSVGVMGKYVGTLVVDADTDILPPMDEHDLGTAIIIAQDKSVEEISFRQLTQRVGEHIAKNNPAQK